MSNRVVEGTELSGTSFFELTLFSTEHEDLALRQAGHNDGTMVPARLIVVGSVEVNPLILENVVDVAVEVLSGT